MKQRSMEDRFLEFGLIDQLARADSRLHRLDPRANLDYSRECVWQNLKNSVNPSIANAYMLEKGLFEC